MRYIQYTIDGIHEHILPKHREYIASDIYDLLDYISPLCPFSEETIARVESELKEYGWTEFGDFRIRKIEK